MSFASTSPNATGTEKSAAGNNLDADKPAAMISSVTDQAAAGNNLISDKAAKIKIWVKNRLQEVGLIFFNWFFHLENGVLRSTLRLRALNK